MDESAKKSDRKRKVIQYLEAGLETEERTETNYHIRPALQIYHLEVALEAEDINEVKYHVEQGLQIACLE